MATKLALIDSDLLLRLLDKRVDRASPPDHPILREMSTIDRQMHGALNDPDLSDLAKSQKINSLLSKHDTFSRQFENQPPPTVAVQPAREDSERQDRDHWYSKIVDSMPATIKHKARNLLDHIRTSKNLQWDRDGRIVIDDVTVPGSNVVDLVHGLTRMRKTHSAPEGSSQFLEALDKINTPKELVPNADAIRKKIAAAKPKATKRRQSSPEPATGVDYFRLTPAKSKAAKKRRQSAPEPATGLDYSLWQRT